MFLLEFHLFDNGRKISINSDAIAQVGIISGTQVNAHAIIHRMDGGYVEVQEKYEDVVGALLLQRDHRLPPYKSQVPS